jgi:hypothetical protein
MFALRAGFWLALVWYLMPMDIVESGVRGHPTTPQAVLAQSMDSATIIAADLRSICGDRPVLCETGAILANVLEEQTYFVLSTAHTMLMRETEAL